MKTVPTGFSSVPPLGPATPVIDNPKSVPTRVRTPSAIASATTAELREAQPGTGHYGIIGGDAMRAALTACLQASVDHER
jgi:hypothetical protein